MYCYRHLTKKRQKDEELMFDDVDERRKRRRRRKTKTASIEKEQKKVKKRFQNKCVSSQNKRYKKRRGRYRSGVSPTFPQLAASSGRTGSVLPWKNPKQWETPINYRKCPTNETNVKRKT
jgi:hypothetical protein